MRYRIILAIVVLLTACSGGLPSESMGRKVLEHQVESQSKGKINLVSFKKTNGAGDNAFYQVEYEAEIEFLADGAWVTWNGMASSPSFEFSNQPVGGGATMQLLGAVSGSENVRQGQRKTVRGVLRFQKTEKGWMGQDGQIY